MSILHPMPEAILKDNFVYRGLFAGCVPVYLGDLKADEVGICAQNGTPEAMLSLAIILMEFGGNAALMLGFKPKDPRGWNPIWITSRIDRKPLAKDQDYLTYMKNPQTKDEPKP